MLGISRIQRARRRFEEEREREKDSFLWLSGHVNPSLCLTSLQHDLLRTKVVIRLERSSMERVMILSVPIENLNFHRDRLPCICSCPRAIVPICKYL